MPHTATTCLHGPTPQIDDLGRFLAICATVYQGARSGRLTGTIRVEADLTLGELEPRGIRTCQDVTWDDQQGGGEEGEGTIPFPGPGRLPPTGSK